MSRDYQTGDQSLADDLLGDILGDPTSSSFNFDPASYFDDWFDDPVTSIAVQSAPQQPPQQDDTCTEFEPSVPHATEPQQSCPLDKDHVYSTRKPVPPLIALEESSDSEESGDTSSVPSGDESLPCREPPFREPPSVSVNTYQGEYEEDELSYDHYEFTQAGVAPFTSPAPPYHSSEDDLESSLLLGRGDSGSRQSFEIAMSEEETAKRARWCLLCLKTYCVIFIITIITISVYVASDFSSDAKITEKSADDREEKTGYKELRLGGRRVYYRSAEPEKMANHTALLVHGEKQNGEIFHKLGSMDFLKDHGVRVVAIDIIGYGRSDPPIHIPDTYEAFFTEIVSLFELEYNLIIVCVELGCEKILPYYLNHGVYRMDNRFIEGAVFISPRGTTYEKYIHEDRQYKPTATRTVVVNGGKDAYVNMEVNRLLSMVPRCEIHALPNLKNGFYTNKQTKSYFHAALEAFVENLEYAYDKELQRQINSNSNQQYIQQQPYYGNQQQPYGNQQQPYYGNQGQQGQQGDMFSKFKDKQSKFQDIGYNPASRFSSITGKGKK